MSSRDERRKQTDGAGRQVGRQTNRQATGLVSKRTVTLTMVANGSVKRCGDGGKGQPQREAITVAHRLCATQTDDRHRRVRCVRVRAPNAGAGVVGCIPIRWHDLAGAAERKAAVAASFVFGTNDSYR